MRLRNILAAAALMLVPAIASAEQRIGDLVIEAPWSRATPGGAKVGAGYLSIVNIGDKPRRLTAASSPIAERVEIHSMTMTNGVMRMRRLENGLELKPQEVTELKPGSFHIMFIGLKQPIIKGAKLPVQLTFDGGLKADIILTAAGIGATHPPGGTEIQPSGSSSGASPAGSNDGQAHGSASDAHTKKGSTSGDQKEQKGSH